MGERTGSRILQWVWSYVSGYGAQYAYSSSLPGGQRRERCQKHKKTRTPGIR
ncbi:hypothetical protein LZ30DRAFT_186288 [Colletotrichum cereale]|nr:hypothetical protein LZ30DRAFT_186288 [Colletotrichum cereale]